MATPPTIPALEPKLPGRGLRAAGLVLPGIRRVSGQITPYTRYWSERNQRAVGGDGPLLIAIGDSTALGIGASTPEHSYIGLLTRALGERDGTTWRVVNLAQSGARAADGLDRQLPLAERLLRPGGNGSAALVVCCIGSNDVVWSTATTAVRDRLRAIIGRLPTGSVVGLVAGGSPRARVVNRAVRNAAAEAGCGLVDPWREPGPPPPQRLAADRFHPNDLGYALMSRPFARHLGAPLPPVEAATPPAD
ncbi:MAG: SGNH/GDSL hydrolase family protein [Actinomycetota bacterium]